MFVGGKNAPYLEDEYEAARTMRRDGVPIKRIAAHLGVSPGTVHRWTTDIELTEAQRRQIDRTEAERWRRVVRQRAESNSDRAMTVFFKRFLVEEFALPPDRFSVALNVYLGNGLTIEEIERDWLRDLGLPASCARKHTTNHMPTSSSGRRKNKLPYGVCTLSVARSTPIVQHIYGAIQEYAGFDEPAWLD